MGRALTIDLYEPGMGALHRAGLGGLATVIRHIREHVPEEDRPAGRMDYDARSVTLEWSGPETARAFFGALYGLAFRVRAGIIDLPATYPAGVAPAEAVRAQIQAGALNTILQYVVQTVRSVAEEKRRTCTHVIDDEPVKVKHMNLAEIKRATAWETLMRKDSNGELDDFASVVGYIAPGFVNRHSTLGGGGALRQPVGLVMALHFALVGCLPLAIGGNSGLLLVPDVDDLRAFAAMRPSLTPGSLAECRVAGPADGALQAQVRLHKAVAEKRLAALRCAVPRCVAIRFDVTRWGGGQKERTSVLEVDPDPAGLERFGELLAVIPPCVVPYAESKKGPKVPYWPKSVLRPFVAENLAAGRVWYEGFRDLCIDPGGAGLAARARQLFHEREGLCKMLERCDDGREALFVRAIHQAMCLRFGAIVGETNGGAAGANRCERQSQEWRIALAHARTADDFRHALADMFSRAGRVPALVESWPEILPVYASDARWRLNRDLALVALASYKANGKKDEPGAKGAEPTPVPSGEEAEDVDD